MRITMAIIVCQTCGLPIEDLFLIRTQECEFEDHDDWDVALRYSYYHVTCKFVGRNPVKTNMASVQEYLDGFTKDKRDSRGWVSDVSVPNPPFIFKNRTFYMSEEG